MSNPHQIQDTVSLRPRHSSGVALTLIGVCVSQLEDQVFLDSYEWVKNCLSLVDYFTNVKNDLQAVRV